MIMEALGFLAVMCAFAGGLYLSENQGKRRSKEEDTAPITHVHSIGKYYPITRQCGHTGCTARFIEDAGTWDDDPMYQLRKLQDEVDDLIEKPLKDEFAKLQAKVEAREYVDMNSREFIDMYWSVPKIPIPRAVFTQPEEEDKSGVSPEERARESLLNDDIAI